MQRFDLASADDYFHTFVIRRPHTSWCDPGEWETYPAGDRAPAFVIHAVTVGEPAGCSVESMQ